VLFRSQERTPEYNLDLKLGWGTIVSGRIHVHVVPGDHLTMTAGDNLPLLVEKLDAYLVENESQTNSEFGG
jgi:hypothetical protein